MNDCVISMYTDVMLVNHVDVCYMFVNCLYRYATQRILLELVKLNKWTMVGPLYILQMNGLLSDLAVYISRTREKNCKHQR